MNCIKCGTLIDNENKFCSNCGEAVTGNDTIETTNDENQSSQIIEQSSPQVRPWVRYWARMFDIYLFGLLFGIVLTLIAPDDLTAVGNEHVLGIIIVFIWIFVESIFLSSLGTTPGKWLLKIRVLPVNSEKLTYSEAMSRSLKVWFRGIGMGIPLVSFITLLVGYNKLTNNNRTSWDSEGSIIIQHDKIGTVRVTTVILIFAAFIAIMVYGNTVNA